MRTELGESNSSFTTFIVFIIVGAILFFGREIFVPLALATLLSFALTPPMLWLRRYIGRTAAALSLVAVVFVAVGGFGTVVAGQFANLARNLPTYQYNLQTKLHGLTEAADNDGVVGRAMSLWQSLRDEAEKTPEDKGATAAKSDTPAPIPVVIREPPPRPIEVVRGMIGPLLPPLATAGLVVLFMIFMLLDRELMRDRFIRLAGARNLGRTTEALDEAASRVSRYLLMQLTVNMLYGVPIGIGLYLIGVPNAALWGGLAVVMRFVPYIGPWIAAAFPLVLSIAFAPGWTTFFETAALFIVVELVTGNVIEPRLYGSSTGLSSIAVILAAVVWTWLWGFVGLILSIPLTVCLVVIGRHVPRLEFLSILLGDEPVLTPTQKFYQRILAADPDEATEQAEACMRDQTVGTFYDEVVIPALSIAETDRERGMLDADRLKVMAEAASEVLDNLEDQDLPILLSEESTPAAPEPKSTPVQGTVLCVPGARVTDALAARYLADLLRRHGYAAHVGQLDPSTASQNGVTGSVKVVCATYVKANATAQARYLVRRLRRGLPEAKIVLAFLSHRERSTSDDRFGSVLADTVVTSLGSTVEGVRAILGNPPAHIAEARAEERPLALSPAHAAEA